MNIIEFKMENSKCRCIDSFTSIPFVSADRYADFLYLLSSYELDTTLKDYPVEELMNIVASAYPDILSNRDKYPHVSTVLTYKGNLRISWSFDMAYNKNIDLIFFPEDNPYINYVLLYANDFNKKVSDKFMPREIVKCDIPYNINYDFVKEILSNSNISEFKQKKFLDSRFGSIFIPMEIEFEWYSIKWRGDCEHQDSNGNYIINNDKITKIAKNIAVYDEYLQYEPDRFVRGFFCALGVIKSFKILPNNTMLNFREYIQEWQDEGDILYYGNTPYFLIFTPLPNTAFARAITHKVDDYFVNVRDKPSVKEGKIVAQLITQYHPDKSNMINPIWKDAYIVFIEAILPNNWCKVLVLKSPTFELDNNRRIIVQQDFLDSFNYAISTITLASGYIHSSGLEYLMPFPKQ